MSQAVLAALLHVYWRHRRTRLIFVSDYLLVITLFSLYFGECFLEVIQKSPLSISCLSQNDVFVALYDSHFNSSRTLFTPTPSYDYHHSSSSLLLYHHHHHHHHHHHYSYSHCHGHCHCHQMVKVRMTAIVV